MAFCRSCRSDCPLPNPPPLRRGGDCRRSANISLPCEAGEGRGGGKAIRPLIHTRQPSPAWLTER
ncbi:hypothetical protein GAY33_01490 [Azospirillum brasilense]|nr:hypothetical protein [Azospirillum argentinense]